MKALKHCSMEELQEIILEEEKAVGQRALFMKPWRRLETPARVLDAREELERRWKVTKERKAKVSTPTEVKRPEPSNPSKLTDSGDPYPRRRGGWAWWRKGN